MLHPRLQSDFEIRELVLLLKLHKLLFPERLVVQALVEPPVYLLLVVLELLLVLLNLALTVALELELVADSFGKAGQVALLTLL